VDLVERADRLDLLIGRPEGDHLPERGELGASLTAASLPMNSARPGSAAARH
jgi:hypothetical protein